MTSHITWEEDFDKYYTEYNHNKMVYEISQPISGVKGFIKKILSQQRKEIVEDVEKTVQKELETWARESIGAKAVESVQKALADIITKLSEEK